MVSIQFQKEGRYHKAVDTGNGREEVVIPAGTVWRGIKDDQAYRWERRGIAIRIADDFAPAIPPAPPAPPPPVEVEAHEGDGKKPLTSDQFGSTSPSPMGDRFARAQAAAPPPPPPPAGNE